MLSQQQHDEFDAQGLVKLPRAIPAAEALRMSERIREYLASPESIRRNSAQEWTAESPVGLAPLTRAGTFDGVATGAVPVALDDLYGSDRWQRPRHWGRALVTFPVAGRSWEVPSHGWHLDGQHRIHDDPPSATVFVVLAPLRPCGGGTLVLTGTHRMLDQFPTETGTSSAVSNKERRRRLGARHPWLHELWSPEPGVDRSTQFLREGAVLDGIPVRIVELTGEPGDAFLMRADMFHAPAPNGLADPRMMLVASCAIASRRAD